MFKNWLSKQRTKLFLSHWNRMLTPVDINHKEEWLIYCSGTRQITLFNSIIDPTNQFYKHPAITDVYDIGVGYWQ